MKCYFCEYEAPAINGDAIVCPEHGPMSGLLLHKYTLLRAAVEEAISDLGEPIAIALKKVLA